MWDIITTCITIKWNVQLAAGIKIWPISPTTWRKKSESVCSQCDNMLKIFLTFSEYSNSLQSGALCSCPIFHLKSSFTQIFSLLSSIWFCCREGYLIWCCAHSECFIRYFKYLTCDKLFSRSLLQRKKYWLNFCLFLFEFWLMRFLFGHSLA